MAIIKEVETPTGAVGSYNKIIRVEVNRDMKSVITTLAIYLNKEAYEASKQPLTYTTVSVPFTDLNQDPLSIFYPVVNNHWSSYLKEGVPDVEVTTLEPLQVTEAAKTRPVPVAPIMPPTTMMINPPVFKANPY